ncbi:MAG: hypothetical protein R6V58_09540, partial [Planctomycetota bacterium]
AACWCWSLMMKTTFRRSVASGIGLLLLVGFDAARIADSWQPCIRRSDKSLAVARRLDYSGG